MEGQTKAAQPAQNGAPPATGDDPQVARKDLLGLLAGATAALAAVSALPSVARIPAGILLLDVGAVWGAYATLCLLHRRGVRMDGQWVAALAPWLAATILVRRLVPRWGIALPAWVQGTAVWPVAVLLSAALVLATLQGRTRMNAARWTTGIAGLGASVGLLAAHASRSGAGPEYVLLGLAGTIVGLALIVQSAAAKSASSPRLRTLAGPAALAVTASQLVDGVVTYLAVNDPLGLAPAGLREQMPLSAWLLETTGIGYPLVKWTLAVALSYGLAAGAPAQGTGAPRGVGTFLLVAMLGLGPGLWSASNLLP